MTKKAKKDAADKTGEQIKEEQTKTPEAEQTDTASSPEAEKLAEQAAAIEKLTAERDDYIAALKRERADFENYKKRNAGAEEKYKLDGMANVVLKLLPVLDNMERAFAMSDEPDDDPFKVGIQMVIKSFKDELAKLGVEEIPTDGAFDPQLHNAIMQAEAAEGETSGNVKDVVQKGYTMKGRVLRYAMVSVIA